MSDSWSGRKLARGLVVGMCATQALDWVSILLYEGEGRATRAKEDRARGHRHAYEVAVGVAAEATARLLD